ncbi:MAG: hypothetical protein D4R63_07475 [Methylococcaceae bacterium]|nr:MAG: hypothetical protein D4R63_07475 [Methylococcaceae bacterium]
MRIFAGKSALSVQQDFYAKIIAKPSTRLLTRKTQSAGVVTLEIGKESKRFILTLIKPKKVMRKIEIARQEK